jgi:hypothetical protein
MFTQTTDDQTSYLVDFSLDETHGLCANYPLRRHKFEAETNAGCHEARSDWIKYIGPIEQFGGCNPINGNFTAVVLPLSKPERLRLIAYVLECKCYTVFCFCYSGMMPLRHSPEADRIADAFLYDNMVELEKPESVRIHSPLSASGRVLTVLAVKLFPGRQA